MTEFETHIAQLWWLAHQGYYAWNEVAGMLLKLAPYLWAGDADCCVTLAYLAMSHANN